MNELTIDQRRLRTKLDIEAIEDVPPADVATATLKAMDDEIHAMPFVAKLALIRGTGGRIQLMAEIQEVTGYESTGSTSTAKVGG